jgi:hypothetical protein
LERQRSERPGDGLARQLPPRLGRQVDTGDEGMDLPVGKFLNRYLVLDFQVF